MMELQDIIANYLPVQAAISFVAGGVIGTAVRLYQNADNKYRHLDKFYQICCTLLITAPVSVAMAFEHNGSSFDAFVTNTSAAFLGAYLVSHTPQKKEL